MGLGTTILGLVIIFVFQLLISEYFVRRLDIKRTKIGVFSKGRKKGFIAVEIILMVLFIISLYALFDYFLYSVSLSMTMYFTLTYLFRGIEEWVYKKENKDYFHEWLASITSLIMFLFFIGDMTLN
ncbi:DUF4181 domain-containing protein [Caldibacillus thermolactis]|uniref:DUF4181 domain-containing protein n=1 Tax=Pallidibacillus thermolactis TaxID=251051 RepID=A0ABT2WEI2_9BACI|nr:DUF4181 domain-containing protein [Pallidibacillus thermolactis]MCU9594075.1 DUF4181 domain-containing protein [Pallidibacillus thermolactis]